MDEEVEEQILACILFDQDAFLDMRLKAAKTREEEWKQHYFSELSMAFQGEIIYSRSRDHERFRVQQNGLMKKLRLQNIAMLGSSQDGLYLEKGFKIIGPVPSEVNNTDLDVVFEVRGVEIFQEKRGRNEGSYLLTEFSSTYPGYVKLRIINSDDASPGYFCPSILKQRLCSALAMSNFYVSTYYNASMFTDEIMSGPALGGAIEDDFGIHDLDFVMALSMDDWPIVARTFLTRKRESGWPTASLLAEISKLGCGFVGVGFPHSQSKEFEWRISFTSAEKFLINRLNAVQIRSYIFLKMLYKEYLDDPECLSSYMMKNVLLWTIEAVPLNTWSSNNVLACVEVLMCQLTYFLKSHNLPNYFVHKRNMIRHKDKDVVSKLHLQAQNVLENLLDSIIKCVECKEFYGMCDLSLSLLTMKSGFLPAAEFQMILSCSYYAMYLNVRLQAIRYKQNLSYKTFIACHSPDCSSMVSLVPPCGVSYLLKAIKVYPDSPCVKLIKDNDRLILDTEGLRRRTTKWVKSSTVYRGILKEIFQDQEHITGKAVECLPEFDVMLQWADLTSQWSGGEPLVSSFIDNSLSTLY